MDIEEKKALVQEKAEANQKSYDDLRSELGPQFDMDTSDYRREMFIQYLMEIGVITEEQVLDFEIKFHEGIWTQLEGFWLQVREHKAKQKLIKPKHTLLGPGGQPISSGG
jgi:hypothetical protein